MTERTRWNDQAIDGLKEQVDDVEDHVEALRRLPERMVEFGTQQNGLIDDVHRIDDALHRAEDAEVRRIVTLRADLKDGLEALEKRIDAGVAGLRTELADGFGRGDAAHDRQTSLKTALQFAALIIVPILLALIGGYFTLRAGIPHTAGK